MERWKLIKRLVDAKLKRDSSFTICLNMSVYTENKLKEYFRLTYEKFSYIKFQKI